MARFQTFTSRYRRWFMWIGGGGPQTLTADPAVTAWTAVDGTIAAGSVTLTTTPAVVTWTANDGTVIVSLDQTVTGTTAVLSWFALEGAIKLGSAEGALACCPTDPLTYDASAAPPPDTGTERSLPACCDDATLDYSAQ